MTCAHQMLPGAAAPPSSWHHARRSRQLSAHTSSRDAAAHVGECLGRIYEIRFFHRATIRLNVLTLVCPIWAHSDNTSTRFPSNWVAHVVLMRVAFPPARLTCKASRSWPAARVHLSKKRPLWGRSLVGVCVMHSWVAPFLHQRPRAVTSPGATEPTPR